MQVAIVYTQTTELQMRLKVDGVFRGAIRSA